MSVAVETTGAYEFLEEDIPEHHAYNLPAIRSFLPTGPQKILDCGCGAGRVASWLHDQGHEAWGCDYSESGVAIANKLYTGPTYFPANIVDDGIQIVPNGGYDGIVSVEVIEHLYDPEAMLQNCADAIRDDGWIILTTPYHGWLKNVALAVSNKMDHHYMVDSLGGHIKFFSKKTMKEMLKRTGFKDIEFRGAGRLPYLWCSMVVFARKA